MIETLLDPRQAIVAGLDQWRHSIVECDDTSLPDRVRDIESVSRMVYAVMLDAVAELESRSIATAAGFRDTKQLLAGMLNLSATQAGTRVADAGQLVPRRALGGEPLAPLFPNTAAALAAGEIGPAQVKVITETMNAIPARVGGPEREAAEAELAHHARSFNSTSLHRIGQHILAHLDPDGPEPRDESQPAPAAGELRLRDRRDGRLGLEGYLEPEHGAAFRSLIEQLAGPRPATEGIPDVRTTPQRNADALLELCRAGSRRPRLSEHRRGTPAPHRDHRLGRPADRSRSSDAGLRDAYHCNRGPTVGVRRENHSRCTGWEIRAPRCRSGHADRSTIYPPRAGRARSWVCFSGL
ncbi:MAG: DUF222 domain-containing protein [Pseudonocardiaceae bacterium]